MVSEWVSEWLTDMIKCRDAIASKNDIQLSKFWPKMHRPPLYGLTILTQPSQNPAAQADNGWYQKTTNDVYTMAMEF